MLQLHRKAGMLLFLIVPVLLFVMTGCENGFPIFPDPTTYTLTIQVEGEGTVEPAEGDHEIDADELVTLQATAATDWRFSHWVGEVNDKNAATTTIKMDQNQTVKAVFVSHETPVTDDYLGLVEGAQWTYQFEGYYEENGFTEIYEGTFFTRVLEVWEEDDSTFFKVGFAFDFDDDYVDTLSKTSLWDASQREVRPADDKEFAWGDIIQRTGKKYEWVAWWDIYWDDEEIFYFPEPIHLLTAPVKEGDTFHSLSIFEVKVTAKEEVSITVPAGTYTAWRGEGDFQWEDEWEDEIIGAEGILESWLAPSVGEVKITLSAEGTETFNGETIEFNEELTVKLVDYSLK